MTGAVSPLLAWDSFYVIIGSSSAALTGLMFVVVTLMPEARRHMSTSRDGASAYATPTILHFGATLLVSAIFTAPWDALWQPGVAVAFTGVLGAAYGTIVALRLRRQTHYRAELEDWVWHAWLPGASYVTLVVAGVTLHGQAAGGIFAVGAATLMLLFIGIHNAWDLVTYMAFFNSEDRRGR